ncbi:hypothetical protein CV102_14145 [Natronococcus pandeyae]|uniref:Uncharacterized protein n=1 Tax=Natronococcus pandeyae TaxID=2055836 RepID=A0A8J8TRM2_9EURY|nr:hypothetical protein [Natronococcus pandeyae]TYL37869.1 hypothetical protein CV102_14145 [Natronococcus pandeyae]
MAHDRIHARKPTHDLDRWSVGTIEHIHDRDGHCVFKVQTDDGEPVELVVTVAIRELVLSRLDLDEGESPVGARVWYRKHGG